MKTGIYLNEIIEGKRIHARDRNIDVNIKIVDGVIRDFVLYVYHDNSINGVRLEIPSIQNIDHFKQFVRTLNIINDAI